MQQGKRKTQVRILAVCLALIVGLWAQGTEAIAAASREAKPAQVTHVTVQAK